MAGMNAVIVTVHVNPLLHAMLDRARVDPRFADQFSVLLDRQDALTAHNMVIHPTDSLLDEYYYSLGV